MVNLGTLNFEIHQLYSIKLKVEKQVFHIAASIFHFAYDLYENRI